MKKKKEIASKSGKKRKESPKMEGKMCVAEQAVFKFGQFRIKEKGDCQAVSALFSHHLYTETGTASWPCPSQARR